MDPFDFIDLMVFCHGVESVGLASIEQWRAVLAQARADGRFAGVDPEGLQRKIGPVTSPVWMWRARRRYAGSGR